MLAARKQVMSPFIHAFSGHERGHHRIHWHRSNGQGMTAEDWQGLEAFALYLGLYKDGNELMFLVNSSDIPTRYRLPTGSKWSVICDTSESRLNQRQTQTTYMQSANSLSILYRQ